MPARVISYRELVCSTYKQDLLFNKKKSYNGVVDYEIACTLIMEEWAELPTNYENAKSGYTIRELIYESLQLI